MFNFYIENHEPFGSVVRKGLKLDTDKSVKFSVCLQFAFKTAAMLSVLDSVNYGGL